LEIDVEGIELDLKNEFFRFLFELQREKEEEAEGKMTLSF